MSKKFHAINRKSGEKWEPVRNDRGTPIQYLIMYDSGYLGVVENDPDDIFNFYISIHPLEPKKWEIVYHDNLKKKLLN